MSDLHKWCEADDLPRRPFAAYRPSLSIRVLGWLYARWDALVFALNAPARKRLRREMDRELVRPLPDCYWCGPAEEAARARLKLPPRVNA